MTKETTVCPRCGGAGWYKYDSNHGKPCEVCCDHGRGWWQLPTEGYGDHAGWWCCKAGCGEVRENHP